jgi:glycosyltransferase involved in cell wall biosynthesis
MNILFVLLGDEETASTRYRVLNLLPHLSNDVRLLSYERFRRRFNRPTVAKAAFAARLLSLSWRFDVVYVQKIVFPSRYTKIFSSLSNYLVFDFDDALYATPPTEASRSIDITDFHTMLGQSDVVVTGSPVLSEYAEGQTDTVHCLPPSLQRARYEEKSMSDTDGVSIGWIGNPENLTYLTEKEDVLTSLLREFEHLRIDIITSGHGPAPPLSDTERVSYHEWSREREIELLSRADVGIRPLIDDAWTRGKGGFVSVLQFMALGTPVVVSPVGVLNDIIRHGDNGLHATSYDEWYDRLADVVTNDELRSRLGDAAYQTINASYWSEDRASELDQLLIDVVSGQSGTR